MSKRSLSDSDVERIRYLFFEKKVNKANIAKTFDCSITTISLWLPVESDYRDKKLYGGFKSDKNCYKCGLELRYHPRCKLCTILLHDNEECNHEDYKRK